MDTLTTHPSTAQQAKAFTSPASLSYPGGAAELTPPSSEVESGRQTNGVGAKNGMMNGGSHQQTVNGDAANGQNGATPATPAATPGAGPTASGIVPTLQ